MVGLGAGPVGSRRYHDVLEDMTGVVADNERVLNQKMWSAGTGQ